MQKIKGFTVVETLITLLITCTLISLGSLELSAYRQHLILTNTIGEATALVKQGARVSALTGSPMIITYFPQSHHLMVVGVHYHRDLQLNAHVRISNLSNLKISGRGTLSPRTITFASGKQVKKIKLQMLWGKVVND